MRKISKYGKPEKIKDVILVIYTKMKSIEKYDIFQNTFLDLLNMYFNIV